MTTRVTPMTPPPAAPARTVLANGRPTAEYSRQPAQRSLAAASGIIDDIDQADDIRSGTVLTSGVPPASKAPDVDQARVILGAHYADEYGMCTACAYLAHFCWAPCPLARQATEVLDRASVTQFRAL